MPATPEKTVSRGEAKAIAALREADPVLRDVIDGIGANGLEDFRHYLPSDSYATLIRAIAGQQLSNAAAASIYNKLIARYGGRAPTPAEILAEDPEELRVAAGLSHAKVRYLRSLAEHVLDGSLDLDHLDELPDEEVIAELVAVKGLGLWSAQMFLIIHLNRPDVLPAGDLGIRKAVMNLYGLPVLPPPAQVTEIGEAWRPYRTLASLFLWRSLHATPM
ncbi:MAG TPA: DNA-3-methyladenine glycosylase [Solirubrobacteraceae bacterium]|nr:DNA-3-methyladenine glycosylase [Solirubrobacteraceae bacterium]